MCVLLVVFVHRPPATMSPLFFLPPFAVDGCLAPEILDKKMGELWMEESMTNWDDMARSGTNSYNELTNTLRSK